MTAASSSDARDTAADTDSVREQRDEARTDLAARDNVIRHMKDEIARVARERDDREQYILGLKDGIETLRADLAKANAALDEVWAVVDRAVHEQEDAQAGEVYHAEINNGGALMAEKARHDAWRTVERLLRAVITEASKGSNHDK